MLNQKYPFDFRLNRIETYQNAMLDSLQSIPIFLSFLGSISLVVIYHRMQSQKKNQVQIEIERAAAEQKRLAILQEYR